MIAKKLYVVHIAHRGGEASYSVVAASFAQAAESVVSQNSRLFPVNREEGRTTYTAKVYRSDQVGSATYVPVNVTVKGTVMAGPIRYVKDDYEPLPDTYNYRIQAKGWPMLEIYSEHLPSAVNDYFTELTETTEFNPRVNSGIPVSIWTESRLNPSEIMTWDWIVDVDIQVETYFHGRDKPHLVRKEDFNGA